VNKVFPPTNQHEESHRPGPSHRYDGKNSNQGPKPAQNATKAPSPPSTANASRIPWRHPHLLCRNCSGAEVTRVARHGIGDYLRSVIYIYPFKCDACGHCFRVFEWGVRYRRQRREWS